MADIAAAYLVVVLVALVIGFIEQAFLPGLVSRFFIWGLAPGWQREIALWNVGLAAVIVGVLRSGDADCARIVVAGIVVLTALLGTNHLLASLSNRSAFGHRLGVAVNYLGVIGGIIVLLR